MENRNNYGGNYGQRSYGSRGDQNSERGNFGGDRGYGSGNSRGYERGGSRNQGGYRGNSGNSYGSSRVNNANILPPPPNTLFAEADAKDPSMIDYSFYDLPVQIRTVGFNEEIPKKYESVDDFKDQIPKEVADNIARLKYVKLTPIQSSGIPIILNGHNVLATSQTGSGKSGAFMLPIFMDILRNNLKSLNKSPASHNDAEFIMHPDGGVARPLAVIMSPTRELALQNTKASWQLSHGTPIITRVCYGGEGTRDQATALRMGCDILVGTPGRMMDFYNQKLIDFSFTKYLILDEADQMLDMGFLDDMKKLQEYINEGCFQHYKQNVQTLLFSATFAKEVRQVADSFMKTYFHITIGEIGVTGMNITQVVIKASTANRFDYLKYMISKKGQMLIFCNQKSVVDELVINLRRSIRDQKLSDVEPVVLDQIDQMFNYLVKQVEIHEKKKDGEQADKSATTSQATSYFQKEDVLLDPNMVVGLHGDLNQAERNYNLDQFRRQKVKILIATDVAQRGLDLPKVDYVINYHMSKTIDDYAHRIGRTGRAGRRGCAMTICTEDEDRKVMFQLRDKLVECNQLLPKWYVEYLQRWTEKVQPRRGGFGRGGQGGQRGGPPRDRWGQF